MDGYCWVCDQGKVWIGGDSAGVSGWDVTIRADSKVFKNGEFLFGFTTSFRMGQLIQYAFQPPKQMEDQDVFAYMCTTFVDALRSCFKAGGFAKRDSEVESAGTFLVGYRGRLFEISGDYQVGESVDGYLSCGCGREYASGAMFATKDLALSPEERLVLALRAAEHHSAAIRGPFVINSI